MSKAAAAGSAGGAAGISGATVATVAAVGVGGYLLLRVNPQTGQSPWQALFGLGPEGALTGIPGFMDSLGLSGPASPDIGDLPGPDDVYGTADDVLGGVGSVRDQIADFLDPNGTGFIDPKLLPLLSDLQLDQINDLLGGGAPGPPGSPGSPGEPGTPTYIERIIDGATNPDNIGVGLTFTALGGAAGVATALVAKAMRRGTAAVPSPVNVPPSLGGGEGGGFPGGEGASGTERTVSTRGPQQTRPAAQAAEVTQIKDVTIRSSSEARSSAVDAVEARRNLLAGEGTFGEYSSQRAAANSGSARQRVLNGQSEFQEYARSRAASNAGATTVPVEDPNVVRRQLISGEADFQQYVQKRAQLGGQAKPTVVEAAKPVRPATTKYSSQVQTRAEAQAQLRARQAQLSAEARVRQAQVREAASLRGTRSRLGRVGVGAGVALEALSLAAQLPNAVESARALREAGYSQESASAQATAAAFGGFDAVGGADLVRRNVDQYGYVLGDALSVGQLSYEGFGNIARGTVNVVFDPLGAARQTGEGLKVAAQGFYNLFSW